MFSTCSVSLFLLTNRVIRREKCQSYCFPRGGTLPSSWNFFYSDNYASLAGCYQFHCESFSFSLFFFPSRGRLLWDCSFCSWWTCHKERTRSAMKRARLMLFSLSTDSAYILSLEKEREEEWTSQGSLASYKTAERSWINQHLGSHGANQSSAKATISWFAWENNEPGKYFASLPGGSWLMMQQISVHEAEEMGVRVYAWEAFQ